MLRKFTQKETKNIIPIMSNENVCEFTPKKQTLSFLQHFAYSYYSENKLAYSGLGGMMLN
ncbi:hypothetical protein FACS1894123_07790 [Bacteroidia bacterium]|nr:hypothetical protein FACS1894123_07790 [Bacteroidia bacterium]